MHRLNELAIQLTPEQVKEVENFAEFLLSRKSVAETPPDRSRPNRIDVDALIRIMEKLPVDVDAVDLAHQATDLRARE